jgi:hypothetical protein
MNKYITLAFLLLLGSMSFGQNVDFKAGNFKDDKDGLKNAQDAIKAGDAFFELANTAIFETKEPGLNFTLALAEFMKAQKFNPNNALLNFKIGVCHLNSTSPFKGIPFINRALELDPACDPFMDYYVGVVRQLQGKYAMQ